jgi:hypothetical protein
MTRYERVTYRPAGATRSQTVILRDVRELDAIPAITGIEVDRHGDDVAPRGVDERRHIIAMELISRRRELRWDLHYGVLA